MTVREILQSGPFEGLPRVIGLPSCHPLRPGYRRTTLAEVCVPDELPPYLLLGRLDRASFHSEEATWSARWVGAEPDTYVEANFERAVRRLQLSQVWHGVDGGRSFVRADDFGRAVQMLYLPFPSVWDHAIAPRLESVYRLKYVPQQQDQHGFTGIPDGGFKTICVPVPVALLATMRECFAQLSSDPELTVPFAGVAFLVERLADLGLVRRRTAEEQLEPGVEFDALVGPGAIDLQGRTVAWMDEQGARRVYYEINSEEELAAGGVERMVEASAQSDEKARELIRQAVLVSVQQQSLPGLRAESRSAGAAARCER